MPEALTLPGPDGTRAAQLLLPEGTGPFPLVVQFMDALGLRPTFTAMGERLAAAGYAVLQPDLYWRAGTYAPFDYATAFTDPAERSRILALMNGFTAEQAMSDTRAWIEALDADPRVSAERIGAVGYCMGGRMTFFAASHLADRVVAAASIHGGGLVTPAPNSPHRSIAKIRGELYFGVAAEDASCPPDAVHTLHLDLTAAKVRFTLDREASARHGYAVPDAPVYDEAVAERHWTRVLDLFARTLR